MKCLTLRPDTVTPHCNRTLWRVPPPRLYPPPSFSGTASLGEGERAVEAGELGPVLAGAKGDLPLPPRHGRFPCHRLQTPRPHAGHDLDWSVPLAVPRPWTAGRHRRRPSLRHRTQWRQAERPHLPRSGHLPPRYRRPCLQVHVNRFIYDFNRFIHGIVAHACR